MSVWLPALIGYAVCLVCCVAWWPRAPARPRPDYEKIARLEVELGLVAPLPQTGGPFLRHAPPGRRSLNVPCWKCGGPHLTVTCHHPGDYGAHGPVPRCLVCDAGRMGAVYCDLCGTVNTMAHFDGCPASES